MDEARNRSFEVRQMTYREIADHLAHTKTMLIGAMAVSLAIVGLGALFVSLWS
jgi:hypothetical protein